MKVLLLSTSSSRNAGGLYNSVRSLGIELFKSRRITVEIFAYKDNFTNEDIGAYYPLPIRLYHILGPYGLGFTVDLSFKIIGYRPNIIHMQGIYFFSSFINYFYSTLFKVPYLISPRGMLDPWILNNSVYKKKIAFFFYENKHIRNASCLHALCLSEYVSIREFGVKTPIAIVPNGVSIPDDRDLTDFEVPVWKQDGRKVLLFLSRIHPKKGLDNLINAWFELGEEGKLWKIVIAGESNSISYMNLLEDLVRSLNLTDDIIFIGPQFHEKKDIAFRFADAFILPSYSEGMPMAVLEAWSYKLPVLMTSECNIPLGFESGAALEIEPDVKNIAEVVTRFFDLSHSEQETIGMLGYQLVLDNYTWTEISAQMTELYLWITDMSRPAPEFVKFN